MFLSLIIIIILLPLQTNNFEGVLKFGDDYEMLPTDKYDDIFINDNKQFKFRNDPEELTSEASTSEKTPSSVPYKWFMDNGRYDCLVGIAINNKPVSVGVFIDDTLILTSANPLHDYIDITKRKQISVYAINGSFNTTIQYSVSCATTPYETDHKTFRISGIFQFIDTINIPVHDLIMVTINADIKTPNKAPTNGRFPFRARVSHYRKRLRPQGWNFAGFGYIDKPHVKNNAELQMEEYTSDVVTDCDEWITRHWGRFICLTVPEEISGISSGAPLFWKNTLFGIGSFAIKRGKEFLLVFTDIRPYSRFLGYCVNVNGDDVFKSLSILPPSNLAGK